jgi:hypothetical protein
VKRTRSQILFNYLPGDTFDHATSNIIGRVTEVHPERNPRVDDLPVSYILDRTDDDRRRWDNDASLSPSQVELVAPAEVEYEIFPRTFECGGCGVCTTIEEGNRGGGRPPHCGYCDRRLTDTEQLHFVLVCPCGELRSVPLPRCDGCGSGNVEWRRPTSGLKGSRWRCADCDLVMDDLYTHIDLCDVCGNTPKIRVHSNSSTFYPQFERFVSIADEGMSDIHHDRATQLQVIADHLLDGDGGAGGSEPREGDCSDAGERREAIEGWAEDALDDESLCSIGEQLSEHRSLGGETDCKLDTWTLESLEGGASRLGDPDRASIRDSLDARDELRFDEVRLFMDFPITTVVHGYSRTEPGPGDGVHLNTFPDGGGGHHLYAMAVDSEAIMISLEPVAVIDWLLSNGVLQGRPDVGCERWLLEHLCEYPYGEVEPRRDGVAARQVLSLLHTMSHVLLNGVDALSGYSKSSLREYLLPHALSFVIYNHTSTEFSTGALHTIVERRLGALNEHIQREGDVCEKSPMCDTGENAACEHCLYLPTMTCDNGNHNLSRSTLFGGDLDGETIDGFLDV